MRKTDRQIAFQMPFTVNSWHSSTGIEANSTEPNDAYFNRKYVLVSFWMSLSFCTALRSAENLFRLFFTIIDDDTLLEAPKFCRCRISCCVCVFVCFLLLLLPLLHSSFTNVKFACVACVKSERIDRMCESNAFVLMGPFRKRCHKTWS